MDNIKKGKIYFVRHGQTQNNLKNNMNTGDDNDPLTDVGIEQAIQAGKDLKESGIVIDLIISSNLDRAIDTGKHIGNQINFTGEYLVDDRLREQDGGEFKGKNRDDIKQQYHIKSDYDFRKIFRDKQFNKIESAKDFEKRVLDAFSEIKLQHKGKNILIVGHSGTSRPLLRHIKGLDFNYTYFEMPGLKNAQVIDLENYEIKK